jgi:excisionase family DNA binding protein
MFGNRAFHSLIFVRTDAAMNTDLITALAEAVAAKLQPKSPRKLYDLKAASEYLGLPPRSVYKLIRDGKIPRVKSSEEARRVLIDVADLDRIIDRAKEIAL